MSAPVKLSESSESLYTDNEPKIFSLGCCLTNLLLFDFDFNFLLCSRIKFYILDFTKQELHA